MDKTNKKKLILRLNRIQGQIEGLKRAINEDFDNNKCDKVAYQTKAVYSALKSFLEEYFLHYADNCLSGKKAKSEIKKILKITFKI